MSEKTILDEIGEWFHNWWFGQPEQEQHEGHSSADESGETASVDEGGGTDETQETQTKQQTEKLSDTYPGQRPRDKGLEKTSVD